MHLHGAILHVRGKGANYSLEVLCVLTWAAVTLTYVQAEVHQVG